MLNWFRKSNTAIPDFDKLKDARDIAGLILAVDRYGNDTAKRQEAIVALGEAVGYWSGYRQAAADKAGIRTLMRHLKDDPNQAIRTAAGRTLGQFRGLSLMGDTVAVEVDFLHPSCFERAELDGFKQAALQANWPLALERIEKILMLPEEASQPDNLVEQYISRAGAWPMDNQPTAIAVRWLRGYLKNLDDADRGVTTTLWCAWGQAMYNVFGGITNQTPGRWNTTIGFRMDTVKGLIYAGTTREVLWDNADAVGIAGCLFYLLAQGLKPQYDKALEFIARADKLKPNHANAAMCRSVVEAIAEFKQEFEWLR